MFTTKVCNYRLILLGILLLLLSLMIGTTQAWFVTDSPGPAFQVYTKESTTVETTPMIEGAVFDENSQ